MSLDKILESIDESKADLWQETSIRWQTETLPENSNSTPIQASLSASEDLRLTTKNLVMHSKGGMGKTVISSMLTQWLMSKGYQTVAVDADPMNNSLARYAALYPTIVKLVDGDSINAVEADRCFEWILSTDADFVVDCGSSGFLSMATYLMRERFIEHLAVAGDGRFLLHTVIAGSDLEDESVERANDFVAQMPKSMQIVLWVNPYFGEFAYERETVEFYRDKGARIVRMPDVHPRLDGADLKEMFRLGLTFAEVRNGAKDGSLGAFSRIRLGQYWEKLAPQIENAMREE